MQNVNRLIFKIKASKDNFGEIILIDTQFTYKHIKSLIDPNLINISEKIEKFGELFQKTRKFIGTFRILEKKQLPTQTNSKFHLNQKLDEDRDKLECIICYEKKFKKFF